MDSSRMLPGGLLQEPGAAKRTTRDWIVDATMLLLALLIGLFAFFATVDDHSEPMQLVDVLLGLPTFVALWWRRRHPFAVMLITTLPTAVSGLAAGPAMIALFNLALRGTRRQLIVGVAVAVVCAAIFPFVYPSNSSAALDLTLAVLFPAFVVPWGLFARTQRNLLRSSHERAERLEAEQRAREQAAREAERRRIAGEMHDVLAHRLSLLSLHAGALEFHPDAPPEEIARAAEVIRTTAHDALRDLREVIGVLRTGDGGADPPQPTLDAIPALVEESRAAGMKVQARIEAEGGDATVGRTAYRVIQEGLTNARKHAPASAVEVTVGGEKELVVVVLTRGSARRGNGSGGSGLIGLAERVELAGGVLQHGPNARGDFVLRAVLPR